MNVLVVGEGIWDDKNSYGNTLSNFFGGPVWENDRFYNFYARSTNPSNKLSVEYFSVTDFDIIKSVFRFKVRSKQFDSSEITKSDHKEAEMINHIHAAKNRDPIYFIHELIWNSHLWLNQDFKQFVKDCKPDIMFAFLATTSLLLPVMSYLKNNTDCKLVLFCADENYQNIALKSPFYRRCYLKKDFVSCIRMADCVYTISEEMSDYYKNEFQINSKVLRKGCEFEKEPKHGLNEPLRFVYAGNLMWGRDDTLARVARTIEKINQNGLKAKLEIYSGTPITPELEKKLNIPDASELMGKRPYDEIKNILHDADVVLHVESFEPEAIELVKYSFSTKITDCLQSGSLVLGIGPKNIASIEYIKKVDGAIAVDEISHIEEKIAEIVNKKDTLAENALLTRQYALNHHEITKVQSGLREDFQHLIDQF